jgi:hypothetical protein
MILLVNSKSFVDACFIAQAPEMAALKACP